MDRLSLECLDAGALVQPGELAAQRHTDGGERRGARTVGKHRIVGLARPERVAHDARDHAVAHDAVDAAQQLSGPLHARQHAHHRQLRRDGGEPLGGYVAHIVQRRGVGEHGGRHSTGSVNLMTAGFNLCVRALDVRGQPTKIMAHGGFLVDEMATDLGLRCDAPVDLVAGPFFAAAVDLRPGSADDDAFLADVLRVPALIRRISVSPEALREGTAAQLEVAAQPEARLQLGFHRVRRGSPYKRSIGHRTPARGAPAVGLDAVDYASAPPPFGL